MRLGLEHATANTMTWLGFKEATEHSAPLGRTDQSPMTIAPSGQSRPDKATGGAQEPTPTATPQSNTPPTPDLLQQPQEKQAADVAKAMAELRQRAAELSQELESASLQPAVKAESGERTPTPEEPKPTPPAAAPPTPPAPPAATPGEGGGLRGIQSNKESMATAIKQAPTIRPGQVAAANGLEIQTRVPRWTISTLMTLKPRNPAVLITFRRDGSVKNVEFARVGGVEYSTGHDAWDQPLLNAIYGWTAKGKPLSELDPADSESGMTILMNILLSR